MISGLLPACAVCFGDPTSPLSRGVGYGVLFLVVIVVGVLTAIAWTAFQWAGRARRLEAGNRP